MITAKTERAFLSKETCEKHFVLSSVVKSYKERICSGQSQRPFTGPEYHPFNEMNQMAAHEYSVLPPLGSSEASLQFYQKRASPNQTTAQSCIRGCSVWTSGNIYLLREWPYTEIGFLEEASPSGEVINAQSLSVL